MWTLLVVLAVLVLTASGQAPRPRAHTCNDAHAVCVYLTDLNSTHAGVIGEAPADFKWFAVGFGTGMASGDAYLGIAPISAKAPPPFSRRTLSGFRSPPLNPQQWAALQQPYGAYEPTKKFVLSFIRPKQGVDWSRPVPVVFAGSRTPPARLVWDGAVSIHEAVGRMLLNLADGASQRSYDAAMTQTRNQIDDWTRKNGSPAPALAAGAGAAPSPPPPPSSPALTTPGSGGVVAASPGTGRGMVVVPAEQGGSPAAPTPSRAISRSSIIERLLVAVAVTIVSLSI
ncbi:hypothetical protein BC828DRAFT_385659 [Blastocladiella britannica]|nr:hypothetical protein BC828DRAFT_385659 [Blastocladiella britannica]